MRYVLAAVIVVTLPALAIGQRPALNPLPSIGLPLPPIGLPLPPIGLDTSIDQPHGVVRPDPGRPGGRPHRPQPAIVLFGAPYDFGVDPALQSMTPGVIAPSPEPTLPPPPLTGTLRLEVEPADTAQVFVDGEYVGTPVDLDSQIELPPGVHEIEVRARGFETLIFDVRVVAGRTVTYRQTMERAGGTGKVSGPDSPRSPTKPTSPATPTPKTTFYLIPGCYLGNVHPSEVKLPANCDFSRMITHTP